MSLITRYFPIVLASALLVGCEAKTDDTPAPPPEPPKATAELSPKVAEIKPFEGTELSDGTTEQRDLLVSAKADFLAQNWSQAATQLEKLIHMGPVSGPQVTAYIALGDIYREQGKEKKALKLHLELLEKAPNVAEVQFVVARSLAEAGETSRAIRAYEMTLKLQPDYMQAYVELGALYSKAGRQEKGAKIFLKYENRIYKMASDLESERTEPLRKLEILEVFSFIEDDRANKAIIASLSSPTPEIREKAVALSAEFRMTSVIPVLEKMALDDPELRIRMIAKEALSMMQGVPKSTDIPTFVEGKDKLPQ